MKLFWSLVATLRDVAFSSSCPHAKCGNFFLTMLVFIVEKAIIEGANA